MLNYDPPGLETQRTNFVQILICMIHEIYNCISISGQTSSDDNSTHGHLDKVG